jgi:7,8-didemethyl-8-hydroxy-5-deazariboflavin synthase CofH subunit/7,8-didemethyl-8-hydroxy-5-deazariboflavin synthase CofG subunit
MTVRPPDRVDAGVLDAPLPRLEALAAEIRDGSHGRRVTYSPKVFVPLTMLCRDRCGYCTFAKPPARLPAPFLELDEVLAIARAGVLAGCHEALFTLGERPEDRYPAARDWLRARGYGSTVDYLLAAAAAVRDETGLLPHANAGAMHEDELAALRAVSASQGMMLESLRDDLACHRGSPDKTPARRLATLESAGRLRIPFTTGILVGIGESRADRLGALQAIAESHRRHGHVQEVIVQNFVPKSSTPMQDLPGATLDDMVDTVRMARDLLPPSVTVQVPPNLLGDGWLSLIDAGARDLGGVSANGDSVSPSLRWEPVERMREKAASIGFVLHERLPVYPEVDADLQPAADELRRNLVGDEVTYVVCRNVNISNVCVGSCSFCGFMRRSHEASGAWHHDHATVFAKIEDAVARGATEICMQSGLQPALDLAYYEDLFRRIKDRWPSLHLHALSPEEMRYIAELSGRPVSYCIERLRDAGLGTMPGTAAEILVEEVRQVICPEKLSAAEWVDVMRAAHRAGVRTTSTVMFGHVENWDHRIEHLRVIRDLQRETGGFTEFVLLPFQVERNALGRHYGIRRSPSMDEVLRYTAIARLYFGADVPNIQSSWVKLGPEGVAETLRWGANDFGGTLMEESISRASGADHGQNLEAMEIEKHIRAAGRIPRERTTTYGVVTQRPRDAAQ